MATVEEKAGSGGRGVSGEVLRRFFREMLLIRRFEEKVEERFRAGELPGFLHVAIGEEATATLGSLRNWYASAVPVTCGSPPPTTAFAPSIPLATS